MTDFVISFDDQIDVLGLKKALITTERASIFGGEFNTVRFATSHVSRPDLWKPARTEDELALVLLGGRIAMSERDWLTASSGAQLGGWSTAKLVKDWVAKELGTLPDFNGAGVVVFLDAKSKTGYVKTDRIGCAPVFVSTSAKTLVLGTHPDSIARALVNSGAKVSLDNVTQAEFIKTGTASHPHTYYQEIKQLDAASVYTFSLNGEPSSFKKLDTYWVPNAISGGRMATTYEFVEQLSDALQTAGRLRTSATLGTPAVLLSAGADSRGVLCSLIDPTAAYTYTYYDEHNPESKRASRIASLAKSNHRSLQRTSSYYIDNALETVRLSGGMWSLESGHHTGFAEEIWDTPNFGSLLTGCYADYLLKGIALNVQPKQLFGRDLPIHELGEIQQRFHHPLTEINADLDSFAEHRYDERFSNSESAGNRYELEYLRVSPLSRETDASGRLALWRQYPIDPIFADSHILDAFSVQRIDDKLSGISFGKAVAKVTGRKIAAVPNNNYGAAVGSGRLQRVLSFLASSGKRKLAGALGQWANVDAGSVATSGSWPNFQKVFENHETAKAWFDAAKNEQFYGLLSPDRAQWSYKEFVQKDVVQLMRLLTLHLWRSNFAVRPSV